MTAACWKRIEQIYHSALNRGHGERAAYLDKACDEDGVLRRQVESLLGYADDSGGFLDGQALDAAAQRYASTLVPNLSGRVLQRFEVMARVGVGGMGQVYRARDTRLNREVALKVLPPESIADSGRRRRFEHEAKAASALNHPNIVTIYDIDRAEGIDFITMEYVHGETLAELIGPKGLALEHALRYAVQIADALAAAHGAGIVHRDLKPANIMVNSSGQVKVLDFGLAKLVKQPGADGTGSTETGMVVGTVAYMSPEQAQGKKVDARSDIFSFGALLYEMLTGRRAFHRDSAASTLAAILTEEPKPAGEIVRDLPTEFEKILATSLRKEPERRFQHTGDLRAALDELKNKWDAPAPAIRRRIRRWRPGMLWAGLLAGATLFAVALWFTMRSPSQPPPVMAPLTTYPGRERCPSFSADGNAVAFHWNGPQQDNFDIYVKLIGAEKPLRLTSDPAMDLRPAWSPDGRYIAFLRDLGNTVGVFLIPAIGGPERKLSETRPEAWAVTWSFDNKWLVSTDKDFDDRADQTASVYAFSVETGERRRLTFAPPGAGDYCGALSPDGRSLIFSREIRNYSSELYVQKISGDLSPSGKPKRITSLGRSSHSPAWMPDGTEIVFVSGTSASSGLWRVPVSGSRAPQRLPLVDGRVGSVAISPRGNRLAYDRVLDDIDIWRVALNGGKVRGPVKQIASTWNDTVPQYSPDGTRIAFDSDRSGHNEVWVCRRDGSDPIQLTFLNGQQAGPPRWSPDGKRIVFCYNVASDFEVYSIDAAGGRPRRLTEHRADDSLASFSSDGRWIYFTSSRTGRFEMWKMPADGGKPVQVTQNGGWVGLESPDGEYLYYAKHPYAASLYKIPVSGGSEQKIAEPVWGASLVVASHGIYFALPQQPPGGNPIEFLSFATGKTTRLMTTPKPIYWYLSVSADEQCLLYSSADQIGSDLMLVENFR